MELRYLVSILALLLVAGGSCLRQGRTYPPSPTPSEAPIPPGAAQVVQLAKEHLAKDKGLDLAKIRVVKVESVEWGDTSLGCPQPGMMYAQVITPGYRVLLSDGTKDYEYHTDTANRVVPCPSPR